MRRMALLGTALICAMVPAAWAADPVGHYTIQGGNMGANGTYSGTVDVSRTGDTFHVIWMIGGTTYVGTAIGNDEFLAITYRSGDDTGIALYSAKGNDWEGIWTYAGGTALSTEDWTRQ
jgi:hypothetical protein